MKPSQTSLFDSAPLPEEISSPTLILEWDELSYTSRGCLGEMTGFRAAFVKETLAKQSAVEVEKWIKCMLYWHLQDRSKGKVELRFTNMPVYVGWATVAHQIEI